VWLLAKTAAFQASALLFLPLCFLFGRTEDEREETERKRLLLLSQMKTVGANSPVGCCYHEGDE